ncbi:MAG: arabinose operon protein AraM [Enhydrobacter sp.]|jgi:glycerol-1-phosphate dehydrogenase [NAD(P)+]|nr:MAG: arabinose operon protein AraM [Enhydrobacter sp.]
MDGLDSDLRKAVAVAGTTRDVVIAAGSLEALPAVLTRTAPAETYVMVADDNTWAAAGRRVAAILEAARIGLAEPIVMSGYPRVKPSAEQSRDLARRLRAGRLLPIAIGSGVINDLVKHAAGQAETPYVCAPTAASMDGYAASGAALREGGFKRTLACAAPVAIVADLEVIAEAPAIMAAWGYGDLAGKLVAGVDWIVADALGEESLNAGPFAMVQDHLDDWLGNPAAIRAGDRTALGGLMRGLVMSGLAMQAHGNSRPASGSDHQFAHLWEMEEVAVDGEPVSHGACVGVGCLSMLAAYEWLQWQDVGAINPARLAERAPSLSALRADVQASFPLSFMAANAAVETAAKAASPAQVERRLRALRDNWPEILRYLRKRLPRAATVRQWLDAVGAPSRAGAVGVPLEKHATDYARARLIRRRYTGLDLLHDLGWLDRAVADLFAAGGFWGPARDAAPVDRSMQGGKA